MPAENFPDRCKRPARHPSSPLSLRCRKTCPVGREELEDCRTPLSLRASNLQPFISSLRSHRERRWVIQSNIGGTPVSQKRFARTIKAVSGGSQLLRCAPQPPAHRPCPSAPAGQDCGRPPLALRKSTDLLSDFRTASAVSRPAASPPGGELAAIEAVPPPRPQIRPRTGTQTQRNRRPHRSRTPPPFPHPRQSPESLIRQRRIDTPGQLFSYFRAIFPTCRHLIK